MSFLKRSRSGSFQPVCHERIFSAYFLGKQPALGRAGMDCVAGPVASLYEGHKSSSSKRVLLDIRNDGLFVKPSSESSGRLSRRSTVSKASKISAELRQSFLVPTKDISFGAVDSTIRKAFAVVVRNPDPRGESPWECYVFLCNSHSDAKRLTYELVNSFQKLAKEKGLDLSSASFLTGRKTMNVFTERGTSGGHALGNKKKADSIITLKVTFNIERNDFTNKNAPPVNENRRIANMLAKQDLSTRTSFVEDSPVQAEESEVPTTARQSASSDKENEDSDSEIHSTKDKQTEDDIVAINLGIASIVDDDDGEEDEKEEIAPTTSPVLKSSSPDTKPKKAVRKTVRFTAEVAFIP